MRANRPNRTQTVNSQQGAGLRRKWRKWIIAISKDVGVQLLNFETYVELRTIVAANPKVHQPSHLHNWIFTNFAIASTVSIRRLDDTNYRSQSLGRLLYEMLEYPGIITKRSHRSLYSSTPELAEVTFGNIAGLNASCLGPRRVRRDLRRLENSCKRLRRFVNKRIAHVGAKGALRKNPTFGELESALGEIDSIVCDYQLLLTACSSTTQKPVYQNDWTDVLRNPWIPKPSAKR